MYQFTRFSPAVQELLRRLSSNNAGRQSQASIAIAKVLADRAILPTGKLVVPEGPTGINQVATSANDSIIAYFRQTSEVAIRMQLAALNEFAVINADEILDYVCQFYMARYYAVFPCGLLYRGIPENGLADFFNLNKAIAPTTLDEIRQSAPELILLYTGAMAFFNENMAITTATEQ